MLLEQTSTCSTWRCLSMNRVNRGTVAVENGIVRDLLPYIVMYDFDSRLGHNLNNQSWLVGIWICSRCMVMLACHYFYMFTALSNLWIPPITYIVDSTQLSYTTCNIMTHVRKFCIYGLNSLRERNGHQQWEGVKVVHQEFLGINIINTKS